MPTDPARLRALAFAARCPDPGIVCDYLQSDIDPLPRLADLLQWYAGSDEKEYQDGLGVDPAMGMADVLKAHGDDPGLINRATGALAEWCKREEPGRALERYRHSDDSKSVWITETITRRWQAVAAIRLDVQREPDAAVIRIRPCRDDEIFACAARTIDPANVSQLARLLDTTYRIRDEPVIDPTQVLWAYLPDAEARARREVKRRVLALFPEVQIETSLIQLASFNGWPKKWVDDLVSAADLIPPEPSFPYAEVAAMHDIDRIAGLVALRGLSQDDTGPVLPSTVPGD